MNTTIIHVYNSTNRKIVEITVYKADYEKWIEGEPLNKCFSYLSDENKYILMTGTILKF